MPFWVVDPDKSIVCASNAAARFMGRSVDEVLGKPVWQILGESPAFNTLADDALKANKELTDDSRTTKDASGQTVPLLCFASPVRDNASRAVYGIEAMISLKQLMEKENEVRARENYFEKLINGIPVMLIVTDRSGRIKYASEDFAKIKGASAGEVIGKTFSEFFYGRQGNTLLDRVMESGKAVRNEEITVNLDGRKISLLCTAIPVKNDRGEVIEGIETCQDISAIVEKREYDARQTKKLIDGINAVAAGDLTLKLQKERDDEYAVQFDTYNGMVDQLSAMVGELKASLNESASECEAARNGAAQISESIVQISGASAQISQGAESLSTLAQETSTRMVETNTILQHVSDLSHDTGKLVYESAAKAKDVEKSAHQVSDTMSMINKSVLDTSEVVNGLNEAAKEIGKVTETIKSIADQTNLLALNAAIEAARAGEHGRGFAVVAEEVRKLAEESRKSTELINELVENVQNATTGVLQAIDRVQKESVTGQGSVENATKSIIEILKDVENIDNITKKMYGEIKKGVEAVNVISSSIEQVAATAEETASASEETTSSTEEQTASTQELKARMETTHERMLKTADMLDENFKLGTTAQMAVHKASSKARKASS